MIRDLLPLGECRENGQGGWGGGAACLLERYPWASVNMRPFDSLSSWWQGEGGCVCTEAGVRREYNPFVSAVTVATAVMKNKNWINKTYFFFSGVAIRHRLPNLPPVCVPRNAGLWQSAQLCLNRGPLPVTPGRPAAPLTHGVVAPEEQRVDAEGPQKARRQAWEMNYTEAKGMRAKQWCLPYCLSSGTIICVQTFSRSFREKQQEPPASLESAWLIYRCRVCLSSEN